MVIQEKAIQLSVKILAIHRDVLFAYKDYVREIKRPLKSGRELKVISHLYNKFLLILTYAEIVFRYTDHIERFEDNKDSLKDADKAIKDIVKEIKWFDESPDQVSVYVRCNRDKIKKALKRSEGVYKSLSKIGDVLERDIGTVDRESYKAMKELIHLYVMRTNALINLLYTMKILMKYREQTQW